MATHVEVWGEGNNGLRSSEVGDSNISVGQTTHEHEDDEFLAELEEMHTTSPEPEPFVAVAEEMELLVVEHLLELADLELEEAIDGQIDLDLNQANALH